MPLTRVQALKGPVLPSWEENYTSLPKPQSWAFGFQSEGWRERENKLEKANWFPISCCSPSPPCLLPGRISPHPPPAVPRGLWDLSSQSQNQTLAPLQWKHRVLIIGPPGNFRPWWDPKCLFPPKAVSGYLRPAGRGNWAHFPPGEILFLVFPPFHPAVPPLHVKHIWK